MKQHVILIWANNGRLSLKRGSISCERDLHWGEIIVTNVSEEISH